MTEQRPAVERPDSASHFYCDSAPFSDTTHHLVDGRCRYCHKTDSQIRTEAGLRR